MRKLVILAAIVAAMGVAGVAAAAPIPIYSSAGDTWTANPLIDSSVYAGAPATAVEVGAYTPYWEPDHDLAKWISYNNTGVFGGTGVLAPRPGTFGNLALAPAAGKTGEDYWIMRVTRTFDVSPGMWLFLDVWADDTARVTLDGVVLKNANFTQDICADGPIGCQPAESEHFAVPFTSTHTATLTFDVYQIGTTDSRFSNPFGLLYEGSVVPEPGSMLLLGTGLIGLGAAARRRLRK